MSLRVLVVEDDREIRALLQSSLGAEGFSVQTAVSVNEAEAMLRHSLPDLVLIDLGLPDGDGATLVRAIRRKHSLPVLVVSARHQEAVKIKLLDAGADDYVTKPFSMGELLARIRVTLRHRGTTVQPSEKLHEHAGLRIDLEDRSVSVNGAPVHLTPTEYKLLARLARNPGKVITHRQLLADVWGVEFTEHTHYLRLYMAQLRAKIEKLPADPEHLLTETGVGYRLASEPPHMLS
jgi:two-component system KDP operon response regulator KdpE